MAVPVEGIHPPPVITLTFMNYVYHHWCVCCFMALVPEAAKDLLCSAHVQWLVLCYFFTATQILNNYLLLYKPCCLTEINRRPIPTPHKVCLYCSCQSGYHRSDIYEEHRILGKTITYNFRFLQHGDSSFSNLLHYQDNYEVNTRLRGLIVLWPMVMETKNYLGGYWSPMETWAKDTYTF